MCNDITLDSENKDILKDIADSISEKWFEDMTNRFNNKNQSTRLN